MVKDFAFDESPLTTDAFDKDQIGSLGWEAKPSIVFGNNMGLFPNEVNVENQLFGDISFPPLMRNSLFNPATAAFYMHFLRIMCLVPKLNITPGILNFLI